MTEIFKGYDRNETKHQTLVTKGRDRFRLGVPRRARVWSAHSVFGNLVSPDGRRRSNSRLYLIKRFANVENLCRFHPEW